MSEVHQAPSGGKGADPSAVRAALRRLVAAARDVSVWLEEVEAQPPAPPGEPVALDLGDREAVRAWLADLRAQVADVVAAGEDATRPPSRRELGQRSARSAILQAERAIGALLAAAERGLAMPAHPSTP